MRPKGGICAAFAIMMLSAAAPAASVAEFVAPGRWGATGDSRFVAPGTWMVQVSQTGSAPSVTATAEGMNHHGIIEFWCRPDMKRGGLRFFGHKDSALYTTGNPLIYVPESANAEIRQPVAFVFDTARYIIDFSYIPWERIWVGNDILSPSFLESFASSRSLEIAVDGHGTVTTFALNGSRKARDAMARVCNN